MKAGRSGFRFNLSSSSSSFVHLIYLIRMNTKRTKPRWIYFILMHSRASTPPNCYFYSLPQMPSMVCRWPTLPGHEKRSCHPRAFAIFHNIQYWNDLHRHTTTGYTLTPTLLSHPPPAAAWSRLADSRLWLSMRCSSWWSSGLIIRKVCSTLNNMLTSPWTDDAL